VAIDRLLDDERQRLKRNLGVDPDLGSGKTLTNVYQFAGTSHVLTVGENEDVNLP
jgi:hypothetical protein